MAPTAVRVLAALCLLVVAALAFRVSYRAIAEVWTRVGAGDPADAWAIPLIIDGMIVVCSFVALAAALDGRRVFYPWVLVGAACAVSVVVNIAHADDHAGARALAAVAPLALLATAELFVRDLRRAIEQRSTVGAVHPSSVERVGAAVMVDAAPHGRGRGWWPLTSRRRAAASNGNGIGNSGGPGDGAGAGGPSVQLTINNLNAGSATAGADAAAGAGATAGAGADAAAGADADADAGHSRQRVSASAGAAAGESVRQLVADAYRAHVDAGNAGVSAPALAAELQDAHPGMRFAPSTVRGELARARKLISATAPVGVSADAGTGDDRPGEGR